MKNIITENKLLEIQAFIDLETTEGSRFAKAAELEMLSDKILQQIQLTYSLTKKLPMYHRVRDEQPEYRELILKSRQQLNRRLLKKYDAWLATISRTKTLTNDECSSLAQSLLDSAMSSKVQIEVGSAYAAVKKYSGYIELDDYSRLHTIDLLEKLIKKTIIKKRDSTSSPSPKNK